MIRFLLLLFLLGPAAAQAHGMHAPVADAGHGLAHAVVPALIALAVAGLWHLRRRRSS